ncbi:hypothetical protein D9M71_509770 [compost metagenome]
MERDAGKGGSASMENHCASSISPGCGTISPLRYSAWKPSISECGNGQFWLPMYWMLPISTPTSSRTSRATQSSTDSPGSTKPARVL